MVGRPAQATRARRARIIFSNAWENASRKFPMFGKFGLDFSNVWKKRRPLFQTLENRCPAGQVLGGRSSRDAADRSRQLQRALLARAQRRGPAVNLKRRSRTTGPSTLGIADGYLDPLGIAQVRGRTRENVFGVPPSPGLRRISQCSVFSPALQAAARPQRNRILQPGVNRRNTRCPPQPGHPAAVPLCRHPERSSLSASGGKDLGVYVHTADRGPALAGRNGRAGPASSRQSVGTAPWQARTRRRKRKRRRT